MLVSEMFGPCLQGEGPSLGMPAMFIRLGGCNLACGFGSAGEHSWVCDSKEIWTKSSIKTNEDILTFFKESGELLHILETTTIVVFTGGEPTLEKHREDILSFITFMRDKYPTHDIRYELETNGAVEDAAQDWDFFNAFEQVNCSPKLANSGMSEAVRIVPKTLKIINIHHNSWFKFVISSEEDWEEIEETYLPHIDRSKIILMPAGLDIEELEVTGKVVWEIACRENVRATTRLQIFTWRKRTGV